MTLAQPKLEIFALTMAKDKDIEPHGAAELKSASNKKTRGKKTSPLPHTVTEEDIVIPAKEGEKIK